MIAAAGDFNQDGGSLAVRSTGSTSTGKVDLAVRQVMDELGIDLFHDVPTRPSYDDVDAADVVITMGPGARKDPIRMGRLLAGTGVGSAHGVLVGCSGSGVFEESLAVVLHGTGGEGADKNEADEGGHRCGPTTGRWSEEGLDSPGDVGGHDAERSGGSVSMHEQSGASQGPGGLRAFGDQCGGVFVGPALDAEAHRAGGGHEQGVDGGSEVHSENPPRVAMSEVGGLMGQDDSAFDGLEGVEQAGRDHDAASGHGRGEGVEVVGPDHDERAAPGQVATAAVHLEEGLATLCDPPDGQSSQEGEQQS